MGKTAWLLRALARFNTKQQTTIAAAAADRCNQPALGRCTAALQLNGLSLQRETGNQTAAVRSSCATAARLSGFRQSVGCLGLLVSVTRRRMQSVDVFIRSTWAHSRSGLRGRVLRVPYCHRPPHRQASRRSRVLRVPYCRKPPHRQPSLRAEYSEYPIAVSPPPSG